MLFSIIVFIYCIVGLVVGAINTLDDYWPDKNRIVRSVVFALLCGPFFWAFYLFLLLFKYVGNMMRG